MVFSIDLLFLKKCFMLNTNFVEVGFNWFRSCHVGGFVCFLRGVTLCVFFFVVSCLGHVWCCWAVVFLVVVDYVGDVSVVSDCSGCFGPLWSVLVVLGCLVLRSDDLRLFMLFRCLLTCLGCQVVFVCVQLCDVV